MNKDLILVIGKLVEDKQWKFLKNELNGLDAQEIAEIINELPEEDAIIIFRMLGRDLAKNTFAYLELEEQENIIRQLASNSFKLTALLNDLDPDDRTAFFEELPGEISQRLIQMLSDSEREITLSLLGYPEESTGRLMTPDYIAVKPHYTVNQALDHIRRFGKDSETINVIYVVNKNWKLLDDLKIKDIILSEPEVKISELMDNKFTALNANDDQEVAVKIFMDKDRIALPVVDSYGTLIGMVTIDDVIDIAEEESTEDFQRFGSLQDAVINPLKARLETLYKQRIMWLIVLVFMNIFSGGILSSFENVIEQVVSLVFFLPLLIDSGGNAGSQSATLMIRAIAIGDVQMRDWTRLLLKELGVSLLLGITMAGGVALVATFRAPEIIPVVAMTMVLTVMAGSMIGILLPFIFTKLKLDPATASAPLITSIADIVGVLIYFSIASWFFGF